MEYIDEKIALLEREARRQEEEAVETERDKQENIPLYTPEEMLEKVRAGSVTFHNQETFEFTERKVLAEQFPVTCIKEIYTGVEEDDQAAVFLDRDRGISQIITLAERPLEIPDMKQWKKQLEEGMRQMNSYAEVAGQKKMKNLDYLIYRTPTGEGWVYNIGFRIRTGSGRVAGNYNCYEKDKKTYGVMLEALVMRLDELAIS